MVPYLVSVDIWLTPCEYCITLSVFKDTYVALIVAFKQNPTTFFTEERGSIEFVDQ